MHKIEDFFKHARFLMNHESQLQLNGEGAETVTTTEPFLVTDTLSAKPLVEITDVTSADAYLEKLKNHTVEWNEGLALQARALLGELPPKSDGVADVII